MPLDCGAMTIKSNIYRKGLTFVIVQLRPILDSEYNSNSHFKDMVTAYPRTLRMIFTMVDLFLLYPQESQDTLNKIPRFWDGEMPQKSRAASALAEDLHPHYPRAQYQMAPNYL